MAETVLYPTTAARKAMAVRFSLPYDDAMQDWEWEVANADEFERYLAAYTPAMPSDQRFSLMEMLVQCVEDSKDEALFNIRWARIRPLLVNHITLHANNCVLGMRRGRWFGLGLSRIKANARTAVINRFQRRSEMTFPLPHRTVAPSAELAR